MRTYWIIGCGALLLLLAGCGKPKFDDPNVQDQYYIYLEDQETHQIVSDQVLFITYKNNTKLCGYAIVESEDQCYKMLEDQFYTELGALKQTLEQEAAQAQNAEQQANQSNGTETAGQNTQAEQQTAPATPPTAVPARSSSPADSTQ